MDTKTTERITQILKFCIAHIGVLAAVITCRSQSTTDTFFVNNEVSESFVNFLYSIEIAIFTMLICLIIIYPPEGIFLPSLAILIAHGFISNPLAKLAGLRLDLPAAGTIAPTTADSSSSSTGLHMLRLNLLLSVISFTIVAVYWCASAKWLKKKNIPPIPPQVQAEAFPDTEAQMVPVTVTETEIPSLRALVTKSLTRINSKEKEKVKD